jgi:hypothetical protein
MKMNLTTKLLLASALTLSITAPVLAQNPQQGDYYRFQPWVPQQATPGQEQRIQQGDYYKPSTQRLHNRATRAQERRIQQGDYYKPSSK